MKLALQLQFLTVQLQTVTKVVISPIPCIFYACDTLGVAQDTTRTSIITVALKPFR